MIKVKVHRAWGSAASEWQVKLAWLGHLKREQSVTAEGCGDGGRGAEGCAPVGGEAQHVYRVDAIEEH